MVAKITNLINVPRLSLIDRRHISPERILAIVERFGR